MASDCNSKSEINSNSYSENNYMIKSEILDENRCTDSHNTNKENVVFNKNKKVKKGNERKPIYGESRRITEDDYMNITNINKILNKSSKIDESDDYKLNIKSESEKVIYKPKQVRKRKTHVKKNDEEYLSKKSSEPNICMISLNYNTNNFKNLLKNHEKVCREIKISNNNDIEIIRPCVKQEPESEQENINDNCQEVKIGINNSSSIFAKNDFGLSVKKDIYTTEEFLQTMMENFNFIKDKNIKYDQSEALIWLKDIQYGNQILELISKNDITKLSNQIEVTLEARNDHLEWVSAICVNYNLDSQVFFSTVDLIDKFLSKFTNMKIKELPLICFSCLFLSIKFHLSYYPFIKRFSEMCDIKYELKNIIFAEKFVFSIIDMIQLENNYDIISYLYEYLQSWFQMQKYKELIIKIVSFLVEFSIYTTLNFQYTKFQICLGCYVFAFEKLNLLKHENFRTCLNYSIITDLNNCSIWKNIKIFTENFENHFNKEIINNLNSYDFSELTRIKKGYILFLLEKYSKYSQNDKYKNFIDIKVENVDSEKIEKTNQCQFNNNLDKFNIFNDFIKYCFPQQ